MDRYILIGYCVCDTENGHYAFHDFQGLVKLKIKIKRMVNPYSHNTDFEKTRLKKIKKLLNLTAYM